MYNVFDNTFNTYSFTYYAYIRNRIIHFKHSTFIPHRLRCLSEPMTTINLYSYRSNFIFRYSRQTHGSFSQVRTHKCVCPRDTCHVRDDASSPEAHGRRTSQVLYSLCMVEPIRSIPLSSITIIAPHIKLIRFARTSSTTTTVFS